MRFSSMRAAMLGLVTLAGTTSATSVSLASFIPRIEDLPSSCNAVYTAHIEGCVADDFKSRATCSQACVQGMVKVAEAVNRSCKGVDVGETSIIGVFQNGFGIQSLCPGITVTTISSSSSTTTRATSQTSTQAVVTTTTSSAAASSTSVTNSSSEEDDGEPSSTSTSMDTSTSTSTGALTLDPNATGTLATSTVNTPPTDTAQPGTWSSGGAEPTQAPNSQLSNADSGGGSPFDVIATGSSLQVRVLDMATVTLVATAVLFTVCA